LRIRAAKPEEAADLSALAQESKAYWGYSPDLMRRWQSDLTIRPDDIKSDPAFVAENDEGIFGFYLLRRGATHWTLEHLWVRPAALRQGIGSQLLHHALYVAAQSGLTRVVAAADPHAAGFYEREGGVLSGATMAPLPDAPNRVLPIYEFESRAA
jgi:GNAT superfamily N-acetyltransferase